MKSIWPRVRNTSPQRGEVDLRSKSGEGPQLQRETVTPHPRLRRDLSLRERWTFAAVAVQSELVMFEGA
jgi:hypothetical protein